ncbi:hypothetical protein [Actinomadura algeriensis]|uniref:Uncharacterized protein n=1 Tax=Actinomadura algeriensis TaxID=1679523 RepID=A0ABR9JY29_9ACTN|nr:hypothetical protein [Actinomadura algeriensis]MBE1535475.1 hypothetical protein [Actinomadura algeriensis]
MIYLDVKKPGRIPDGGWRVHGRSPERVLTENAEKHRTSRAFRQVCAELGVRQSTVPELALTKFRLVPGLKAGRPPMSATGIACRGPGS